jgi:acetyltransferase-like isoleucine patch superfamily enzyme
MTLLYYWAKLFKKLRGKVIVNSRIHKTSKIEAGSEVINSTFDRHSFCGYNCAIINCDIGAFCSISNNVLIGGGRHPMEWVAMSPVFYEGKDSVKAKFSKHEREQMSKTVIGHDVWIGANAILKQGVKIGIGAVVGMGSVVTKDIEPYSVVAGCPAKVIRKRFNDHIIDELLDIKWWDFSDKELRDYAQYFTNPTEFIKRIRG